MRDQSPPYIYYSVTIKRLLMAATVYYVSSYSESLPLQMLMHEVQERLNFSQESP